MAHLQKEHDIQDSSNSFERIMVKSTFRPFGITNCPLCDEHGVTDSLYLTEHVLEHIYDFSMYAVAWQATKQADLGKPIQSLNDVGLAFDNTENTKSQESN
jgi:hypothetical protein